MEKELKEKLDAIFDAQVVLYKKLDDIECKLQNTIRMKSMKSYRDDLEKLIDRLRRES